MSGFVSLKDVKKIYQMGEVEIMAAAGINFEIQKGEFAVVVGPSGAGKTTVLNILGGMDTATSGQVLVDGEDKARPLSDQKLCQLLEGEGVTISRRTVAKYRDELGISSASGRRARPKE